MCEVSEFILRVSEAVGKRPSEIKRHNDNLRQNGEFSFRSNGGETCKAALLAIKLPLPVEKCLPLTEGRLHVFLDRTSCIRTCLANFSERFSATNNGKRLTVQSGAGNSEDLSHYRALLIANALGNVAKLKGYTLVDVDDPMPPDFRILVSGDSKTTSSLCVYSAPVLNKDTGLKEQSVTTEQYRQQRIDDMKMKAVHKYRVTVTDREAWNESSKKLGEACANMDLLRIKPSSPASVSMNDGGCGPSRGGHKFTNVP